MRLITEQLLFLFRRVCQGLKSDRLNHALLVQIQELSLFLSTDLNISLNHVLVPKHSDNGLQHSWPSTS